MKLIKRFTKTKSFRINNGGRTYSILNQGKEPVVQYRPIPDSREEVKKRLKRVEKEIRRLENEKRSLLNDRDFLRYGDNS